MSNKYPVNSSQELAVRQLFSCSLEPQVVARVLHCTTAGEIWNTLESCFENKTTFALTDLIGKMNSIRFSSLDQIESRISEIQAMATRIKTLGGLIDRHTIENAILKSLPPSFTHSITTWEFVDEELSRTYKLVCCDKLIWCGQPSQ